MNELWRIVLYSLHLKSNGFYVPSCLVNYAEDDKTEISFGNVYDED